MNFERFAAAHGLLLRHVEFGKWVRTPTEDKPRSSNGAYKHLGDVAFVQNHATMTEPAVWFPEKSSEIRIDREAVARMRERADRQMEKQRQTAEQKAQGIIKQSIFEQHAYLDGKGFPEARGLVYYQAETQNLLVIPMRVGTKIVGAQLIDRDGVKKFLYGQRCAGAEFVIGTRGKDIWCEGYATGLSIHTAARGQHRVHVCFSARNMQDMARAAGRGFVIADNDESGTGEKAAQATGLPYFMPPDIGTDFNDLHQSIGTFGASQILRGFLS